MFTKKLSIFNLIALLIHISLSYGTQLKLVNPKGVGEVSDKYPSLFTPAGFTFAIWGLIYVALLTFCIYHIVRAFKADDNHPANRDTRKIGYVFIVNNLVTAGWLIAWTNEYLFLSVILILIQLITLLIIHRRLSIHDASRDMPSKFFTQVPLSIYFGWITIATLANTSTFLHSIRWSGWGVSDINWTITLIATAVMITVWVINRRRNTIYGLVVLWALYGIMTRLEERDPINFQPIIWVAMGGMAIVALAVLFSILRNLRIKKIAH